MYSGRVVSESVFGLIRWMMQVRMKFSCDTAGTYDPTKSPRRSFPRPTKINWSPSRHWRAWAPMIVEIKNSKICWTLDIQFCSDTELAPDGTDSWSALYSGLEGRFGAKEHLGRKNQNLKYNRVFDRARVSRCAAAVLIV
jgi:hypothetical protein